MSDTYLNLSEQNLREVPKSILENKDITTLDLSDNQISVIPEFICELKSLTSIYFENNKIKEVPKFLEKFQKLVILNLSGNDIETLTLDFYKMTSLLFVDMSHNRYFISIDESIYAMKQDIEFKYKYTMLEKSLNPLEFLMKRDFFNGIYENNELESLVNSLKRINGGTLTEDSFEDLVSLFQEFILCGYEPEPTKCLLCADIIYNEMKNVSLSKYYYSLVIEYALEEDFALKKKAEKMLIELEKYEEIK